MNIFKRCKFDQKSNGKCSSKSCAVNECSEVGEGGGDALGVGGGVSCGEGRGCGCSDGAERNGRSGRAERNGCGVG